MLLAARMTRPAGLRRFVLHHLTVHKTATVLNKLPKSQQSKAKRAA
jgi:hypothetical protein